MKLFSRLPALAGVLLALLLGLQPWAASAQPTEQAALPTAEAEAAPQVAPLPYGEGVFWRISKAGHAPSHILGTIHVNDPRVLQLPPQVLNQLYAARSLSLEILNDADTGRALAEAAWTGGRQTLDAIIGPDLYRDLVPLAEPHGVGVRSLRHMKPWVVIFLLSRSPDQTRAEDSEPHLDAWLNREAERRGIATYALETMEEHLVAFEALTIEEQRRILKDIVRSAEANPETDLASARMEGLIEAWLAGEIGRVLQQQDQSEVDEETRAIGERFMENLLDLRNQRMVEAMRPRLEEGGAFVAVGAAHLPGEEGILKLLAERGWTLTRLH